MKVKEIKHAIECPVCGEIHSVYRIPDECKEAMEPAYECGECGSIYDDRDDAKECCRD